MAKHGAGGGSEPTGSGSLLTWPKALALGLGLSVLIVGFQGRWGSAQQGLPDASPPRTLASPDVDSVAIVNQRGLGLQLFLLAPTRFGVTTWKVGAKASYDYRLVESSPPAFAELPENRRPKKRRVEFEVVGRATSDHEVVRRGIGTAGNWWLRIRGLSTFRHKGLDRYALVKPDDLRTSRTAPLYSLHENYFPVLDKVTNLSTCSQAQLERLGTEVLDTPLGRLECERFIAHVADEPLQLWTHPEAGPLGLVRLISSRERLELVASTSPATDAQSSASGSESAITPLIEGQSTFALGCLSCHFDPNDCHSTTEPAR